MLSVAMMISVYQIINLAGTDLGALIESSGSEGRRRESCGHKVPVSSHNIKLTLSQCLLVSQCDTIAI